MLADSHVRWILNWTPEMSHRRTPQAHLNGANSLQLSVAGSESAEAGVTGRWGSAQPCSGLRQKIHLRGGQRSQPTCVQHPSQRSGVHEQAHHIDTNIPTSDNTRNHHVFRRCSNRADGRAHDTAHGHAQEWYGPPTSPAALTAQY
jgi:hypothetical protein